MLANLHPPHDNRARTMDVRRIRQFGRGGARILFVAFLAASPAVPAAAESLLPLTTETAHTLPSGTAEVVLGTSYFRNLRFPPFTPPGVIRSQNLITGPEFGFQIAAGGRVEIQARFELISLDETLSGGVKDSHYGAGDARLFTKVRILEEKRYWPTLGVRFGTKLPNANQKDRLGTDETDFGIETLLSKDFGPLAAHVNLGLLLLGNPGPVLGAPQRSSSGQDDLFSYSVALVSRPLGSKAEGASSLRFVGEVTGLAGSRFDNDRTAARLGLQIQSGGLTVYSGVSAGLVTASEDFGVRAGLIYAFELERLAGLFE